MKMGLFFDIFDTFTDRNQRLYILYITLALCKYPVDRREMLKTCSNLLVSFSHHLVINAKSSKR